MRPENKAGGNYVQNDTNLTLAATWPSAAGTPANPTRSAGRSPETWPFYDEDEIAAVVGCLRSGQVNQWTGPQIHAFERAYDDYLGSGRSIAVANGTLALELALHAFGIGPGDEVIVTPRSFVASAACVRLLGATPVFVDVDPDSGCITAEAIESAVTSRTKAVIPVHLGGWPVDMPAVMEIASRSGIKVIEDCAQAHGARIAGQPVGSFGDAAAFSFCQDKIITTGGEGGLVVFQDDSAFEWARSFKDHGKSFAKANPPSSPGTFRWLHDTIGTNWRMTSLAAAIGLVQLAKLEEWRASRERHARIWASALSAIEGIRVPWPDPRYAGAFYKFYCYIDRDANDVEDVRDRIIRRSAEQGLRVFAGSCSEIYRERAFDDLNVEPLAVAKRLGATSLMFEVHPTLDEGRLVDRADKVATLIRAELA